MERLVSAVARGLAGEYIGLSASCTELDLGLVGGLDPAHHVDLEDLAGVWAPDGVDAFHQRDIRDSALFCHRASCDSGFDFARLDLEEGAVNLLFQDGDPGWGQ